MFNRRRWGLNPCVLHPSITLCRQTTPLAIRPSQKESLSVCLSDHSTILIIYAQTVYRFLKRCTLGNSARNSGKLQIIRKFLVLTQSTSLMQIKNRMGSSTLPCGTPINLLSIQSFRATRCCRLWSHIPRSRQLFGLQLRLLSLWIQARLRNFVDGLDWQHESTLSPMGGGLFPLRYIPGKRKIGLAKLLRLLFEVSCKHFLKKSRHFHVPVKNHARFVRAGQWNSHSPRQYFHECFQASPSPWLVGFFWFRCDVQTSTKFRGQLSSFRHGRSVELEPMGDWVNEFKSKIFVCFYLQ